MERQVGSQPNAVANRLEATVSVKLVVRRHVVTRTRIFFGRRESIGAGDLTFVVLVFGTACRQEENEESGRQPQMDWSTVVSVHDPGDTEAGVTKSSQAAQGSPAGEERSR